MPERRSKIDVVRFLQELVDARDAEIAELKEKLAQAEESESNAWGEAEEYKGRIDSAIALIGWDTLPAPVSSITLRRIRSLLGEDLEGAHVASLREFLEGVPWKVHTPATLQHFPIVITPQSRRLIEEIVPEPQRSWVIEAGEEYMRNRE